jgi:hypothetical protein
VGGRKLGRNFLSIFLGKLWKDFSCEFFGPFLWGFYTLFGPNTSQVKYSKKLNKKI